MIREPLKISLFFMTLLASVTNIQAAELAIISDYKPNCIVDILAPISLTVNTPKYQDLGPPEESTAFALILHQLREEATAQGADIVLLTNVKNKKITIAKRKTSKSSLIIHIEAQLYTVCEADKSFSHERTAYTADGYELQTMSYQYTISPNVIKPTEPIVVANNMVLPAANISFATGVYDIKLGASTAQTAEKLGPPSITLTLLNHEQIWGYGRNLWFTYSADRLKSVSSELSLLNSAGQNSIGYRDGFDDIEWQLEGIIAAHNSPIEQVRDSLSQYDIKESSDQIVITQKQQRLILQFDDFHPTTKDKPVTLLTHFTLTDNEYEAKKQALPQLTSEQEQWLYKHLQPNNVELMTLPNLLKQIPQTNKINIASDEKQWWLVGNHVLLQFDDIELSQAHISEPFFTDSKSDSFSLSVKSLQLPQDKQGMLALYEDAIDNNDAIDILREHFNLIAKFESEEDDAVIYDLFFTYY
ncbi:hypothetical protein [Shewanella sp. GutCb]|uniref:hypothetical protein n=1 Tax=Shewanella sp. GutCb TaxID=2058315 RepID=UPI0011AE8E22|nr:hypothetical protein [Shewanella sp. GutCb]